MGSVLRNLTLTLVVAQLLPGLTATVYGQISGIDYYRSRLNHRQPQSLAPPRQAQQGKTLLPRSADSMQKDSKVSPTVYQLPVKTDPNRLYDRPNSRFARKLDVFSLPSDQVNINWNKGRNDNSQGLSAQKNPRRRTLAQPVSTRGTTAWSHKRVLSRQIEDVFGEEQVPEKTRVPRQQIDPTPDAPEDGVVIPPDAIGGSTEPSILNDADAIPGIAPKRDLPQLDQRLPFSRKRLPDLLPNSSTRDENKEQEADEPKWDHSDPLSYDPADPRHPDANNGPDSWYRPERTPANRFPDSYDPNLYGSRIVPRSPESYYAPPVNNVHPTYAQPAFTEPQAIDSTAAVVETVYSDCCSTACNGAVSYSCGDCYDCGTGIVNGCYESVFYLSLFGGYTNLTPITVTDTTTGQFRFEMDDGYLLGAALGQFQGRNLRTEIEFSFRENDLASLTSPGNAAFVAPALQNAALRSYSGMANAIWEFIEFPAQRVKPYVGAGFGFVNAKAEASLNGANALAGVDDSDSSFGYQAFGGINFRSSEMLEIFAEYRYLKADSMQLGNFGFDYETSNIFGGARIKF